MRSTLRERCRVNHAKSLGIHPISPRHTLPPDQGVSAYTTLQWDPAREHIRPIPPWAIRLPPGDTRVFDQYTMDTFAAAKFKGKVAFLTGIRAQESLVRFRASVNKLNDSYINASSDPRVSLCKPIYDFSENDVFKFFYDNDARYCPIYDAEHVAGGSLRVSTPLHAESAKDFGRHRTISPIFYQQVVTLFPEMLLQERYWSQLDRGSVQAEYGQDLDGVRRYIDEHVDPSQRATAIKHFESVVQMAEKNPAAWPAAHVLKWAMGGAFKRMPTALYQNTLAKRAAR